ncbi:MAG: hypothetical protein KatS3mg065_0653 [Chloroflexota bacterium]|nr:MAG: hypothetical protein KatS3mg065_0653 [Chloroflexota bacterium]
MTTVARILEVDLVDDAGPRRDDAEVPEGGLGPAEELVALGVPLVLPGDVEEEGVGGPEAVDLDGVVDDEVGRDEGVDLGRVAAEGGHGVAHGGEVDDGRHAGEVLEDDPGRHEGDLGLAAAAGSPGGEGEDVLGGDDAAAGVAEGVLEEDLQGDGGATEVDPVVEGRQAVVVGEAGAQGSAGAEGVAGARRGQGVSVLVGLVARVGLRCSAGASRVGPVGFVRSGSSVRVRRTPRSLHSSGARVPCRRPEAGRIAGLAVGRCRVGGRVPSESPAAWCRWAASTTPLTVPRRRRAR